jgi:two-component system sensor histidine kinase KdpD
MLAVGLIISNLTANIRTRALIAGYREQRTAALYAMSRELASVDEVEDMVRIAVKHVAQVFDSQAVILLPDRDRRVRHPRSEAASASLRAADLSVAQWVLDHGEPAGLGTDTLPGAPAHYLPLAGSEATIGVLAILPANPLRVFVPEQQKLLETFASQIALALERAQLGASAKVSELAAESERLRNALLAAISHDLRTPLASIVGASSSLAERGERMSDRDRTELARAIHAEAQRMTGLIDNVLDMARLQSGAASLNRQWHPLEELVGATIKRLERTLAGHRVQTHIPPDLPLVNVDGVLIGQLLANLLENAAKYTPRGTTISISAETGQDEIVVSVADEGPGLPPGEEERIFDKFHRAAPEGPQSGVGLGLSICKAIVQAHGGTIAAENLPAGGAVFRFTLPLVGEPPQVSGDDALREAA